LNFNSSAAKVLDTDSTSYVIKIRKTELVIDGEKRIIVMVRDLSDSINFEKI